MTRLALLADPHCDDFGSRLDPATGLNSRWLDTVGMVRWVANDAAVEYDADALIVAGDFTEARHPAPWRVAQIGEALDAFDGRQVYVSGNHDGRRDGRSIVDVLAGGRADRHGFSRPGITVVGDTAIAALPYLDRASLRTMPGYESVPDSELTGALAEAFLAVARGLYVEASKLAPQQVLVVHQALAGGQMSDGQAAFLGARDLVVDTRAVGAIGFAAVLAGHFHKHQELSKDPLVVYAGAPYRTDFGEEGQIKCYLVVDVEHGKATYEVVGTPARRFVTLRDIHAESEIAESDVDGAVVRVVDMDPDLDVGHVRAMLHELGAFDVQSVKRRRLDRPEREASAIADAGGPADQLAAYFDGDPDAPALLERGRELLAQATA